MRCRRTYILFCFTAFATLDTLQAKSLLFNILITEPNENRNYVNKIPANENTNKNSYTRQTISNCVDLSRNTLCLIYEDDEKVSGLNFKPKTTSFPQEATYLDLTRFEDDLGNLQHVVRTNNNGISFSEDYLDVGDLSVTRKDTLNNPRNLYSKLKLLLASFKGRHSALPRTLGRSRKVNVADLINFIGFRTHSTDDSSDDESIEKPRHKKKKTKPKRFEVIENSNESTESKIGVESNDSSNELEIPVKKMNDRPKIIYIQGPTRHIPSDERRSRLPHFMPKRYHWNLEDINDLPYFWFNGPQGYFAGVYKAFI